jgi:CBS domain containing-hemolysin-like protein
LPYPAQEAGTIEIQVIAVFVLVVLSALASATETALTSLGPADLHNLIKKDKHPSRLLVWWHGDPNRVLTAILIVNNLINILASSLATAITQTYLISLNVEAAISIGVAVAVGVMTFLIVMFGEVLPKTFARNNPRSLLPFFPVMYVLCALFSWPARALQVVSSKLISVVGGAVHVGQRPLTEEQIDTLIMMGSKQGALSGGKGDLLSSIIEFSDTLAMEILVPRTEIVGFEVEESLDDVLKVVFERKFSRYPVYEEDLDTIVGILTTKDLLEYFASGGERKFSLRDLSTRHRLMFFPETKKIGALLQDFQKERIQMAVAVDEFGGTAGIVTIEDMLEEIVGEIYDEHEKADELIRKVGEGAWMVKGRAAVEDLAEVTGIELPDQDIYETVAGLVMTHAGKVPLSGERISFAGLVFEVRERTRTKVVSLAVTVESDDDTETGDLFSQ